MGSAKASGNYNLAVAHFGSPYITVYPFSTTTGFGTKYANPSTLPNVNTDGCYSVSFSPTGSDIAVTHDASPYFSVYRFTSGSGFGAKYSDPGSPPETDVIDVKFSPSGNDLIFSYFGSPALISYAFTSGSGIGSRLVSDPSPAISNLTYTLDINPAGNVVIASQLSQFSSVTSAIIAYPFTSGTGFGTKFSDPSSPTTGQGSLAVAFSPLGNSVALTSDTAPGLQAYVWSNGFGSKYTDPSTFTSAGAGSICYSPSGNEIAVISEDSPYIHVFPFSASTGFGTKYSNPAILPVSASISITGIKFSPDGKSIAMATDSSPYINVWGFQTEVGFGTKFSNPSTLPTGLAFGIAFSPN